MISPLGELGPALRVVAADRPASESPRFLTDTGVLIIRHTMVDSATAHEVSNVPLRFGAFDPRAIAARPVVLG